MAPPEVLEGFQVLLAALSLRTSSLSLDHGAQVKLSGGLATTRIAPGKHSSTT